MEKRGSLVDKKSVLTGVSTALSTGWLLLQLTRLSSDSLPDYHPVVFVPLAFAGLLSAVIILRFLIRKHSARMAAVAAGGGALLGASLSFFTPTSGWAFLIAFVLLLLFSFVVVREIMGSKTGANSFVLSVVAFIPLSLAYILLPLPLKGTAAHTALSLLLPGISLLLCRAARRLDDADTSEDFPGSSKGIIWAGLTVSLLGVLASAARLVYLQGIPPEYRTEMLVAGAAVSILTLFFMLWLRRENRAWQALYSTLASFAVGILLSFACDGASSLFFRFLPFMLLVISGAGMTALFFAFCCRCASPINRPLACGAAYIASYSLISLFFACSSGELSLPDELLSCAAIACSAAVLLLSPALLRGFHTSREPGAVAGDAGEGSGDEAMRSGTGAEEDIMDFGALTKQLTNSEKKVFELILSGYSNQQIADELFISINTVKFHIRNVLAKIGVQRKSELLAIYVKNRQTQAVEKEAK